MNDTDTLFLAGLSDGSVYAVFQPVINRTNRLIGFEILIRWKNDNQILLPDAFLPMLKSKKTWLALADYLINIAVNKINAYQGCYFFSFNISGAEVINERFVEMIINSQKKLFSADWIRLLAIEFSEKIKLNGNVRIAGVMNTLQDIGCTLYLDDILSYDSTIYPLQVIKFNGVKIDRNVVDKIENSEICISLIKTIIYFCSLTGAVCVAEGVENNNQLNMLRTMGGGFFQGYLISTPIEDVVLNDFVSSYGRAKKSFS
ncbi:EAL domain-containing protein [Mangrovibacter phragmitis]|uniref:EAL domain-containing protein n=1 Tax=Mangrovibacter phragmitis TaxID=1691903 RepID=UPI0035151786